MEPERPRRRDDERLPEITISVDELPEIPLYPVGESLFSSSSVEEERSSRALRKSPSEGARSELTLRRSPSEGERMSPRPRRSRSEGERVASASSSLTPSDASLPERDSGSGTVLVSSVTSSRHLSPSSFMSRVYSLSGYLSPPFLRSFSSQGSLHREAAFALNASPYTRRPLSSVRAPGSVWEVISRSFKQHFHKTLFSLFAFAGAVPSTHVFLNIYGSDNTTLTFVSFLFMAACYGLCVYLGFPVVLTFVQLFREMLERRAQIRML